jgi:hypothetical protein
MSSVTNVLVERSAIVVANDAGQLVYVGAARMPEEMRSREDLMPPESLEIAERALVPDRKASDVALIHGGAGRMRYWRIALVPRDAIKQG